MRVILMFFHRFSHNFSSVEIFSHFSLPRLTFFYIFCLFPPTLLELLMRGRNGKNNNTAINLQPTPSSPLQPSRRPPHHFTRCFSIFSFSGARWGLRAETREIFFSFFLFPPKGIVSLRLLVMCPPLPSPSLDKWDLRIGGKERWKKYEKLN